MRNLTQFRTLTTLSLMSILCTLPTIVHAAPGTLRGTVKIDGSSTVFPISEAAAEEFLAEQPRVRVTVGVSGTGGGFKKFLAGETDINNASRRIKNSEKQLASQNHINYIELPIAYDGISVVVNKNNSWAKSLSVADLKNIWHPEGKVKMWRDLNPSWPAEEIKLYGPGTDSGTFDYFTKVINGKSGVSRADYTASEDDNTLVRGISGDKYSLGFFGYAYYAANQHKLNAVAIRKTQHSKAVMPTSLTINNNSYTPLARPVFIYINAKALKKPEVYAFVSFYIEHAGLLANEVGYVELQHKEYEVALDTIQEASRA